MTNFTAKYLYNIRNGEDIRRGIQITTNDGKETKLIEFRASDLSDLKRFKERLLREGNFWFMGGMADFRDFLLDLQNHSPKDLRICNKIGFQDKPDNDLFVGNNVAIMSGIVEEPTEGVFCFGDDNIVLSNNIVTKINVLPSVGKEEYKSTLADIISAWYESLNKNHDGLIALAFLRASLYATPIIDRFGFFPFLLVTGEKGSGKNFFCKMLLRVIGIDANGDGITNSTQVGIMRKSQQFSDLPYWLDEYSDSKDSGKKIEGILRSAFNRSPFVKSDLESATEIKSTICTSTFILSGESLSSDIATRERFITIVLSRKKQNLEGKAQLVNLEPTMNKIGSYWIRERTFDTYSKRYVDGIVQELGILTERFPKKDNRLLTLYAILSYFLTTISADSGLSIDVDEVIGDFLESDSQLKESSSHVIKFWEDFITLVRKDELEEGKSYYLTQSNKLGIHFPSVKSAIFQSRGREKLEQRIEETTLKMYLVQEYGCEDSTFHPSVNGIKKKSFKGLGFDLEKLPDFVQEQFKDIAQDY